MISASLGEMDSDLSPISTLTVTETLLTGVLLDPEQRRYLEPFFGRALTVSDAAAGLGVKGNSLLYQVKRFCRLGLLLVVCTEKRGGRTVKIYRASADRFFVPFARTDAETLEELFYKTNAPRARRFARNLARVVLETPEATMGYLIGRHEGGEVDAYFSPDGERVLSLLEPSAPAAGRSWVTLTLTHEEAKALQREQWELWDKYLNKRGGQRYLAHFDLTPVMDD